MNSLPNKTGSLPIFPLSAAPADATPSDAPRSAPDLAPALHAPDSSEAWAHHLLVAVAGPVCPEPETLWQECYRELGEDLLELYAHYLPEAVRAAQDALPVLDPEAVGQEETERESWHEALLIVRNIEPALYALRALMDRLGYAPEHYRVARVVPPRDLPE